MMACEGVDTWLSKAATGNVSGDTMTVLDDGGSTIGTLKRSGFLTRRTLSSAAESRPD